MREKKLENDIKILLNQFNAHNYENVIIKSKSLLKKNPQYVILYNLLGSAYQNTTNFEKARDAFEDGLKLDPHNIAIKNNLAMSYKNLLDYKTSEKLFNEIILDNEKYLNAFINLGNLKRDVNKFQDAIKLYNKALEIDDKNSITYYSLALAYQGIGKFNQAVNYAKKSLDLNPKFVRADNLISQSIKYENKNKHYISLKEKIGNISSDNDKIELHFAVAKAEEDLGNIEEATKNLIQGNKLKKKISNYDIRKDINLFKNIKEIFSTIKIKVNPKNIEDNIIFILGLPRSGTSLVEQIISSHSKVYGCGELPILSKIVKENFISNNLISLTKINDYLKIEANSLQVRSSYDKFLNNFEFKEKFSTDKAPLNFRWIGFIKLIFPNSKIIHCTRDSKDNCLSMFKNLFEGGLNFTYDQDDLVDYYENYIDLMQFWKSLFKDQIFDVKYENLVGNNEDEIKKIIQFCNLEMEQNCLLFHKNKSPIKTMSTAQARKPIYKTSVKSFEKFSKFLTILDKRL